MSTFDLLAWVGLPGFALLATITVRRSIPDDAFIYLRFAENLSQGAGWVFNRGEPVAATTSPLYTVLLALARMLGIGGPSALLLLFATGLVLVSGAVYSELRHDGRVLAFAAALVAITWPPLLRAVGMETSLFLAAIALAALAYGRGRPRLASALAGAGALLRPEGMAMLVLLLIFAKIERRRMSRPLALPFFAVVSPWLIFSWTVFGSPIPHSARVKSIQASIDWWSRDGPWISSFARQVPGGPLMLVLLALGARQALRSARSGRPFALIVSLFGATQVVGYGLLGAPPGYSWYYAPGNFAVVVLAACGLKELELAGRKYLAPRWRRRFGGEPSGISESETALGVMTLLAVGLYGSVALGALREAARRPYRLAPEYTRAAGWLAENGSKEDWVASDEIGYIGYYSGLRMRDMLGLLHSSALEPLRRREWDWWFTSFPPPRFVVVHAGGWIGEPMVDRYPWPEASLRRFSTSYVKRHVEGMVEIFELRRPTGGG